MTDVDERLRRANPILPFQEPDAQLSVQHRQLFSRIVSGRVHRTRKLTPVALVSAILILGTGTWAIGQWMPDPQQQLQVLCVLPGVEMDTPTTGDPVGSCRATWESVGIDVPDDLVLYQTEGGGLVVTPVAELGEGMEPLPEDFRQDHGLVEMKHALNDAVLGISNRCLAVDEAEERARHILDGLGLSAWSVGVRVDDPGACVEFWYPDDEEQSVILIVQDLGDGPRDPEVVASMARQDRFTRAIHAAMAGSCLDATSAVERVRSLAIEHDMTLPDGMEGVLVIDDGSECARAYVSAAGGVAVVVYAAETG